MVPHHDDYLAVEYQSVFLLHLRATQALAAGARADFRALVGRLQALSPLASLERGFSIVRHDDRLIRSYGDVQTGDTLSILLYEGTVTAEVTGVQDTHDIGTVSSETET